jgi:hypothetical protein
MEASGRLLEPRQRGPDPEPAARAEFWVEEAASLPDDRTTRTPFLLFADAFRDTGVDTPCMLTKLRRWAKSQKPTCHGRTR